MKVFSSHFPRGAVCFKRFVCFQLHGLRGFSASGTGLFIVNSVEYNKLSIKGNKYRALMCYDKPKRHCLEKPLSKLNDLRHHRPLPVYLKSSSSSNVVVSCLIIYVMTKVFAKLRGK